MPITMRTMPDCPAKAGEVDDATLDGLGMPRHSDLIYRPHANPTKSRTRRPRSHTLTRLVEAG